MTKIKSGIYGIIRGDNKGSLAASIFDATIMVLILVSVLFVIVDTFSGIPKLVRDLSHYFEIFSITVFTIEYMLRIWTADKLFPSVSPFKARVKYLFSFMALVDLFAILPFYLPFIFPIDLRVLRMLRLLRLVRLLKIGRYTNAFSVVGDVLKRKSAQLFTSLIAVIVLMVMSSILMYAIENETQPDVFENALSGLWWAVSTVTTVGYGDVYPITLFGKLIGAVIALLGIGLIAIPTSIISAGFLENIVGNKKSEEERPLSLSGEAGELLRVYETLDVRRRTKLLDTAFALEKEKTEII
jgi:voltage-gated potassium channel